MENSTNVKKNELLQKDRKPPTPKEVRDRQVQAHNEMELAKRKIFGKEQEK